MTAANVEAKGGARKIRDRFYAHARYGRKDRIEVVCPWASSEAEAEERARVIADIARKLVQVGRRDLVKATARQLAAASTEKRLARLLDAARSIIEGAVRAGASENITIREWGRRYTSGELARDYPDHVRPKDYADDASRLKNYINPHVGDVPVSSFSLQHADLVMRKLPSKKVRTPAARRHIAQVLARLLHLAVYPGKIIPASPLPRGWLPKLKARRHYSCLFPREEALFLAHRHTPFVFRLFCGVLNREGMRISELLGSQWFQWNLDEGTFTATKTKTLDPRMWALRPDVAEAMREWRKVRGTDKPPFEEVGELYHLSRLADAFRAGLQAAGVKRPELFSSTEHTGRLRAHDMRATFVTVSLAEGRTETWIRDRTAHKSTAMIDRYRRTARQFSELKLGSLVDLAAALRAPMAPSEGGGGSVVEGSSNSQPSNGGKLVESHVVPKEGLEPSRGGPRRILNAPPVIGTYTDPGEIPAETHVSVRRETGFHHFSTTPSLQADTSVDGTLARSSDRSTIPMRVRVEVGGREVGTVEGGPRRVARGVARALRRAGLPAVAKGARVYVGRGAP